MKSFKRRMPTSRNKRWSHRNVHDRLSYKVERYRFLTDFSPIGLAEWDTSNLHAYLETLRQSGVEDFRAYFQDNPDAVVRCVSTVKLLRANKTMVSLLDVERKREPLWNLWRNVVERSHESFRDGLIAYAEGKDLYQTEMILEAPPGVERCLALKWSFFPGQTPFQSKMLCAWIDVTDLKRAQEELKQFKTVSDSANVGNALSDKRGCFLYVNQAFAKMHGYEIKEVVGKHYSLLHTNEQLEHMGSLVDRLQKEGSVTNEEIWHRRKDGSAFPTLTNTTIVRDENGRELYVSTTAIDITLLKQIQSELEIKNQNLEEANIALRVVIRNIEQEQTEFKQKVIDNVKMLVSPFFSEIKKTGLTSKQRSLMGVLESNLFNVSSPFSEKLSGQFLNLTVTEVEIATLIREGRTTAEIAEILHLSSRTVDTHRYNIRKKLGIGNKKANLRTLLMSV